MLAVLEPRPEFPWLTVVSLVNLAMTLAMLVDAVRRPARSWIPVILFPLGAWVYFVAVVMRPSATPPTPWRRHEPATAPPTPLAVLRQRAETTPSVFNRLNLARGLVDAGEPGEAHRLFLRVLEERPDDPSALDGAAQTAARLNRLDDARAHGARLLRLDPAFDRYEAALRLAEWHERAGDRPRALAVLRRLTELSGQLRLHLRFAEALHRAARTEEARRVLTTALGAHEASPAYVRRDERREAAAARRLLRQLD